MLRDLIKVCTLSATNAGPLSLQIVNGRPNQGTISLRRTPVTSRLHSVLDRKTSTQPEYIHTINRRYLYPLLGCTKAVLGSSLFLDLQRRLLPSSGQLVGAVVQVEHYSYLAHVMQRSLVARHSAGSWLT